MLLLLAFAFIGGVVTILSPCILPILPIVLSGSLSGGHRRPIGIVAGFVLSFTFFTLALTTIVKATGLSPDALRLIAVIVIFLFGLSLLSSKTQALLEKLFSKLSLFAPKNTSTDGGFWSGIPIGISLGLIWAPCVGPILASVITLALTSQVTATAFFITLAYSLGTAIPMLIITYGGRSLLNRVPWLLRNTASIQKGFGVLMIITALAIQFNLDRKFQTYILTTFPQYGAGLTAIEDNETVRQQLNRLEETKNKSGNLLENLGRGTNRLLSPQTQRAPEITGNTGWLQGGPLTIAELRGKVVLVDFWTYSCINCIRTLPYLREWHEKYADDGLVIIGVHSPEFEFEKDPDNVRQAVADFELEYPIAQDNDFAVWQAYSNRFWPAKYLIDKEGYIRYTHFGEGKYSETEQAIRELLGEEALNEEMGADDAENAVNNRQQSPEIYLGYTRAANYSRQNDLVTDAIKTYTITAPPQLHAVALGGSWELQSEAVVSHGTTAEPSTLQLQFLGSKVFLVASLTPGAQNGSITVNLDGEPLPNEYWTTDMSGEPRLTVSQSRKYDIIDLGDNAGQHLLELEFSPGVAGYAFTFGS